MLEYEWRELERLCERLADLRHRESFALRSKNVGLLEGLKEDIARTRRQREQLVHHISARLGSVTAEQAGSPETASQPPPPEPRALARTTTSGSGELVTKNIEIVDFPS